MKCISIFLVLFLSACASNKNTQPIIKAPPTLSDMLASAHQQLEVSKPKSALTTLLNANQQCIEKQNVSDTKTFIHRTSDERFFYLLQASFEQVATSVETGPCADISYLLGYTYLELDDIDNAQDYLTHAVEYSPVNATYLAELGYIYQAKGEYERALKLYTQAEENAQAFSPPHLKTEELTRAKRGIGYCLIELGLLDEAEAKLAEVIKLNPGDVKALSELNYIESQR